MALFKYVAKNKEGQDIRSSIEASSRLEALEFLRKKGLTVVDLVGVDAARPKQILTDNSKTKSKKAATPREKQNPKAPACVLTRNRQMSDEPAPADGDR